MDGVKIYDARIRGGKSLAKSYPVEADLVTGVPESGIPAAKGYSEESGIPFGFAFYKNSYIGRTFIKPTQKETRVQCTSETERSGICGQRQTNRSGG